MNFTIFRILSAVGLDTNNLPNSGGSDAPQSMLSTVLVIVFSTLGAVSLLMVVLSGLRYTMSAGDPQKMSQAKNAIIYALVGLAIALSGFSIVTFVVKGTS